MFQMGISDAVKILQDILDSVKNINETDAFSKVSQGQVRNSVFDVLCLILLKYDVSIFFYFACVLGYLS